MAIVEQPKLRYTYVHVEKCKAVTWVGRDVALRLRNDPDDCETLYCTGCRDDRPIEEFAWVGPNGSASEEKVCQKKS